MAGFITRHRLTVIWFVLVALTVANVTTGGTGSAPKLAVCAFFLVAAAVKSWLIVLDYLELRHAPGGWRAVFLVWLAVILALAFTISLFLARHGS